MRVSIVAIFMITHMFVIGNLVLGQQQQHDFTVGCPPINHGDTVNLVEPTPALVSAVIESCKGWQLSKLPALKEFLLGGDAEAYQRVQVKYTMGRRPTMTIYHIGNVYEIIQLEFYHSKAALHQLFKTKGFLLKSNYQQQ